MTFRQNAGEYNLAYTPIKSDELKQLVLTAKRRTMNFAYNPGPKDDDLLIVDKKKSPEVIGRVAKAEGKGSKAVFGTFLIEEKKAILTTEIVLPGMAKKLRKYLKKLGLSFTIDVKDPSGKMLESDAEEDNDDQPDASAQGAQPDAPAQASEPGQQPETTAPDPALQAIKTRIRDAQGPIAQLGPRGEPLKKAMTQVVLFVKSGDLPKATTLMGRIEDGLQKAQAAARDGSAQAQAQPKTETAAPETQAKANAGPDPKALIARATSLKNVIDSLPAEDAQPIKAVLVQALGLLKSRDFSAADLRLTDAEQQINALSSRAQDANQQDAPQDNTGSDSDANTGPEQEWLRVLARLTPLVEGAMRARKGDLDGINRAFNYAQSQAQAKEYASALKAAENTERLIRAAAELPDDAGTAAAQEAADVAPDNVVGYTRSRQNWIRTRIALKADLVKLKMSIDAATRGVEGLEEIASNTDVLLEYIDDLDTSLESTLNQLSETPDGQLREKLKQKAIEIIKDYRSTFDSEFFRAVDDNGFANTNIRGTALDALMGVEDALAA